MRDLTSPPKSNGRRWSATLSTGRVETALQIRPAAGPQVTPARTYLVFFDWDRAELTTRVGQIVAGRRFGVDACSNDTYSA